MICYHEKKMTDPRKIPKSGPVTVEKEGYMMGQTSKSLLIIGMLLLITMGLWIAAGAGLTASGAEKSVFPRGLESYDDQDMTRITQILRNRAQEEPFNLAALLIFFCAIVHTFLAWTIFNTHYPGLFISGLLFFLGFAQVTAPFQNRIDLKPPLLVGFFLGGLVVHGGVQGWWIEPVLSRLGEIPLMLGATILTAFNDNAAITFLSTLVPKFTASLKYAVVAGAVTGGGLTVIANAPNPAGQSLLKKYFDDAVSPVGLLKGALLPTVIAWLCFAVFF